MPRGEDGNLIDPEKVSCNESNWRNSVFTSVLARVANICACGIISLRKTFLTFLQVNVYNTLLFYIFNVYNLPLYNHNGGKTATRKYSIILTIKQDSK